MCVSLSSFPQKPKIIATKIPPKWSDAFGGFLFRSMRTQWSRDRSYNLFTSTNVIYTSFCYVLHVEQHCFGALLLHANESDDGSGGGGGGGGPNKCSYTAVLQRYIYDT